MKNRMLSSHLIALIERIAEFIPESDSAALLTQSRCAVVVSEIPGRMLDVEVPAGMSPVSLPEGQMRPHPSAVIDGQLVGELMVWASLRVPQGLERLWYTDEAPNAWPETNLLKFN